MIRHIIAIIAGALTVAAIVYMANLDKEAQKFQKIKEIIEKSKLEVPVSKQKVEQAQPQKEEESEEEKKLKVLKEKAGRMSAFEVSPLYRRNCASCHGINGEGAVGPKLVGKTKEDVLNALKDFKSGKRKNYVMFGLLNNMKDEDLESLATEIGTFEQKLKASE
ncbi:c-type cytochrome [Nitrosophilus kaiyonis]|uniref:c-type cytochrome n=1 Tax=Nitrosophilus kaiyonis TaxID=2930200 RepID=UPI00249116B7|nr:c-type cytochrome [Nitrosophilus kaiyonis]